MANTKITSRVLADNAVLTANITDANVTTAKVADNAVTGDKVADDVALAGNPTTTTQSAGNNTTRIATTAFVSTAVANLADSAPDALNTLNELAAAMGDDANFSTTITNSIAAKLPLAGGTMTGNIVMGDDTSIGIADDAERIEFDGAGDISFLGANVGIGTTSPDNTLHVYKGDSGHSWSFDSGDSFILENSDSVSLNIATPNSNNVNILFSDAAARGQGRIVYDHNGDYMAFATNGVSNERMRIDSTGSVGINVAPSADWAGNSVLQMSHGSFHSSSSFGAGVSTNLVATAAGWSANYLATGAASAYLQATSDGSHRFYTVASGSAGASATLSEKMRIDSSGKVGIGVSTPSAWYSDNLVVSAPSEGGITIASTNTSNGNYLAWADGTSGDARYRGIVGYNHAGDYMFMSTAGAERMRINSSGFTSVSNDPNYISSDQAGLQVERGGLLIHGTSLSTNFHTANHHSNYWTFIGSGGVSGSYSGNFRISVPNPQGAAGTAWGGLQLEIYISGYNAKFCHAILSGYTNGGVTLSESTIIRSSGSHSVSYGIYHTAGGSSNQGFYFDVDIPSYVHPAVFFRITRAGDASTGKETSMKNLKIEWS